MNQDKAKHIQHETVFRRGYLHGTHQALNLVFFAWDAGLSFEDVQGIAAMYEDEVSEWRNGVGENPDTPPNIDRDRLLQIWRDHQSSHKDK